MPFFFGSPLYSAFKRVVIEIAKNRTNPHLVPGHRGDAARLADGAAAARRAGAQPASQMAVIAGDIEGGNLLKRLGVLLTDFLLFDNVDNDLVVDTAGDARRHRAAGRRARAVRPRRRRLALPLLHQPRHAQRAARLAGRATTPAQLDAFQPLPGRLDGRFEARAGRSTAQPRRDARPTGRWSSCCPA